MEAKQRVIIMSEECRSKVRKWKKVVQRIIHAELEVGVDKHGTVG